MSFLLSTIGVRSSGSCVCCRRRSRGRSNNSATSCSNRKNRSTDALNRRRQSVTQVNSCFRQICQWCFLWFFFYTNHTRCSFILFRYWVNVGVWKKFCSSLQPHNCRCLSMLEQEASVWPRSGKPGTTAEANHWEAGTGAHQPPQGGSQTHQSRAGQRALKVPERVEKPQETGWRAKHNMSVSCPGL